MKKRILVTGGAGFLGTNLCRRLVVDGHDVISFDIENPRWPVNGVNYRRGDVADNGLAWPQTDEIYHLACPASPPDYMLRPIETLRTAVLGTLEALQAADRRGSKILIASTSEVYGDPLVTPQHETYNGNVNPFGPRAVYDEGKRAAEAACFAMLGKVNLRLVRIFNTYGPFMRLDDGRMIPEFIGAALRGEFLPVFGGGQRRSLCFVDDLIEGFLAVMAGTDHGPVNLGNPDERSVEEVARLISDIVGVDHRTRQGSVPVDDPLRRCPDIDRANRIGWAPKVKLEEGLRRTVGWFRQQVVK